MGGKVMQWIKGNILIVISCLLIVIVLPVGYFFSAGWNASIQEKADKAYKSEKQKLTSAGKVNYQLPAVLEGEESLEETRAPNALVTRFYAEKSAERQTQVDEVIERGVAFNKANHEVLVEGVLPNADNASELRRKGYELGQLITGTEESQSVYTKLLRKLNARGAPHQPKPS